MSTLDLEMPSLLLGLAVGFVVGCLLVTSVMSGPPSPPPTVNELRASWATDCIRKGTETGKAAGKEIIAACTETASKIITPETLPDAIPGAFEPQAGAHIK